VFMTLWNTYAFFVLYANLDRPNLAAAPPVAERPSMDRWLKARVDLLVLDVTADLEAFDPTSAGRRIRDVVVDELSNWYVRLNRRRFWRGDSGRDSLAAYATLHEALVTIAHLMAPLAPFTAEALYQNLVLNVNPNAAPSVHLSSWPQADAASIDPSLLGDMVTLQKVVELARAARAASKVKVRQPLPELLVRVPEDATLHQSIEGVKRLEEALRDELNVKAVRYLDPTDPFLTYDVRPNLPKVGKRLGQKVPAVRAALAAADGAAIAATLARGDAFELVVEGERFAFTAEELLLDARSPEGFAAVENQGWLAALNTTLTPALVREGLMRDAVRLVQDARKQAGLAVSDRIVLSLLAVDPQAQEALREHQATLMQETLAAHLSFADTPADAFETVAELGEGQVRIALTRAG